MALARSNDHVVSSKSAFEEEAMESACANVAEVTLRLKKQFQKLLGASPGYGDDKRMTREMDTLGMLIKELEDGIVILQIQLDELKSAESNP